MRAITVSIAAALLLGGCDDAFWQTLAEAPVGMPSGSTTPTSTTTTARSPAPVKGEAIPALDLSALTWVPEQPGTFDVQGDRIVVPDRRGLAYLYYRPALGADFTLRFHESREQVTGDITVGWMLDREDAPKHDAAGNKIPHGEHRLVLSANGTCKVIDARETQAERKITGPRDWAIEVAAGHTTVTVNGEVLASYEMAPGYHAAPFLSFAVNANKAGTMAFDHVAVTSSAPGARYAIIRQWSMAGRGVGVDRFNLVYASDWPQLQSPEKLDTLPAILPHVVAAGGYPLFRGEAIVYARTDGFSGGTHGSNGIFLNPALCQAGPVSAHEMSHGYNAAGSLKARSGEGFLVEGFADYLCYVAYNRYTGQPEWKSPPVNKLPAYDPLLSESNADTTARDGSGAVSYKIYTKGRMFFEVLSAYTSPEDVRAVVVSSRAVNKLTGEMFVKALEARTGKDLGFLRPGWLVAGPYQGVSPKDAADADKDGLLDFQEIAWGTNPKAKDTDGDGASDFAERAAGTNPLVAATGALNGFASGGSGGTLPDMASEEAVVPEEGTAEEETEAAE